MELFSLEDDDVSGLFITQSDNSDVCKGNGEGLLSEESSFIEPNFSLLQLQYKNISDDEFEIPSLQKRISSQMECDR